MQLLLFVVIATMVCASAIWVVMLRNLFRAALSLGLVLLGVAVLFILLEAEFLAFVQILVYVGAILTLVVFAIMLTAKLQAPTAVPASRQTVPAAAVSIGLFMVLTATTQSLMWPASPVGPTASLSLLGQELIKTLVLPFEVISLVFVAAMVGAIAIAADRSAQHPPP